MRLHCPHVARLSKHSTVFLQQASWLSLLRAGWSVCWAVWWTRGTKHCFFEGGHLLCQWSSYTSFPGLWKSSEVPTPQTVSTPLTTLPPSVGTLNPGYFEFLKVTQPNHTQLRSRIQVQALLMTALGPSRYSTLGYDTDKPRYVAQALRSWVWHTPRCMV